MEELKNEMEFEPLQEETPAVDVLTGKERRKQFRKGLFVGVLISILALLLILVSIAAILIGRGIIRVKKEPGQQDTTTKESFLNSTEVSKMKALYDILDQYYYKDIDEEVMADALYHAVAEGAGDEYTAYFSEEELDSFNNYTDNSFYGIGVLFSVDEDGYGLISKVYNDSPALEAGILAGDRIIKVFGESVVGMTSSDIASKIKGAEGTVAEITILRGDEEIDLEVERRSVTVETVGVTMINDIAYVEITKFGDNTAAEFAEAIQTVRDENAKGVIFDLRDNGGGRVDAVVEMMDLIFGEGVTLTMEYAGLEDEVYTSDEAHKLDLPMVVLVNENSASASEIFAAAAKDFKVGALVGTTTFGKGVHQRVVPLTDGSALKITSGKFYSPNGDNFDGVGITPDIEVEYEFLEDAELVYGYEYDSQLVAAFNEIYRLAGIDLQ